MKRIGEILGGIEVKAIKPKRTGDSGRSTSDERTKRLLDAAEATQDAPKSALYQHTALCQTSLPYRNPGDDVRTWTRTNGKVGLRIEAGTAWNPELCEFVQLGLPYGTKPRLLLAYLNREAMVCQSPTIEVEQSLTGFVRALGLAPKGQNIVIIKDQLSRLAASSIRLGLTHGNGGVTIKTEIVSKFELWFPKDERQRVVWPTTLTLHPDYFESLLHHAVPLHDRALMALSGSAMALDVYAWLAQRLHRIEWGERVFVAWAALKTQFGWHYERMNHFKAVFRQTLRDVHSQYRAADIDLDGRGITLRHSPPPVKGRTGIVVKVP